MLTSQMKDYYNDIEDTIQNIMKEPKQNYMSDLQYGLNKFFSDSNCKGVIYTHNQDKLFFGLYVMPSIEADIVIKTITNGKRCRVKDYYLELDSKLFEPFLGLSFKQITALLIHEIGALTGTSAPSEEVTKQIDQYLLDNHETLKLSDLVHYKEMLSFGFRDALRKCASIFERGKYNPEEDTQAQFIDWVPYVKLVTSALEKIDRMGYNYNKDLDTRFIGLSWVLRVYRDVLGYRISAIKTLERMQELSPSQIEKKEFNNFARRLNRIDDDMLLESASEYVKTEDPLLEEIRLGYKSSNILDEFDLRKNDYIDILMKEKNCENEPDAMPDLLNSVNRQMMMIKDYAENNENDPVAFKQWNSLFKELAMKRNHLAKSNMFIKRRGMINKYKAASDQ